MNSAELFWSDFSREGRKKIMAAAGISSEKDHNWDVFPVTTLEFDYDSQRTQKPLQETEEGNFKVTVCRIGYGFTDIRLRCKPEELEGLVLDIAGGHEYSEKSSDYEIDHIDEVDPKTGQIIRSHGKHIQFGIEGESGT